MPPRSNKRVRTDEVTQRPTKAATTPLEGPTSALGWLLHPGEPAAFFSADWERAHRVVRREDPSYYDRLQGFAGASPTCISLGSGAADSKCLFSRARLLEIMKTAPIEQVQHMQVLRVADGARESASPPADGVATSAWVGARLREGYTVQLFQPQTWCPRLHCLLAALEAELNCLVGCSAYLTPSGCQGLAPHHDDVEVIVLQTEGSKRWKLYPPLAGRDGQPHEARVSVTFAR